MAKKKQNVIEQSKDFDSLTDDKIRDIVAEEMTSLSNLLHLKRLSHNPKKT